MKPSKVTIPDKLIDQFLLDLDKIPISTEGSPIKYNTAKLIDILRVKEIEEICNGSPEEFKLVNDIDIEYGAVVRDIVHEKDLEKSIDEYHALERKLEKTIPEDLYVYSRQAALSVKALYYYKAKQWDKTIAITKECIALNDYLVQQGMHTLNLRVFEQNKNISRTYFRAGRVEEGYALLFNLFNYTFNGVSEGLFGNMFNLPEYWKHATVVRETYTYEMFLMIVEDMIRFNLHKYDDFLPNDWYSKLDFEVDNVNRQVIYNWIYVNNELRKGNYEEFFDCITFYFNQPVSQYYDMLKIALLLDTEKLIRLSNYPKKVEATEKIRTYIEQKIEPFERLRKKVLENGFPKVAQLS